MKFPAPGSWRDGLPSDAVVTDQPGPNHQSVDADCLRYYGGYLVAESIDPCYKSLIKATPDLLVAVESFLQLLEGQTEPLHPISWQVELEQARAAYAKAIGGPP